ncbi:MAG: alpha/beta hydrolase-fold protein [Sporichthyaceae bacterium]
MSTSPAVTTGPEVTDSTVTFRFADLDRALTGVRLSQDVRIPRDRLDFRRGDDGDWTLQVDGPDVDRMEYSFELTHSDGGTEHVLDPANDTTSPGAFGDKSVVLLPGYEPPDWLGVEGAGDVRGLAFPARALGTELPVRLWVPPDTADDEPLPLLAVHDGPEYDELAALTSYLGVMASRGALPRVRAALLSPGPRNDWYSANGAYTRALCLAVLPHLRSLVTTTAVVGMGASLGALAMLHAQRRHAGSFDALFLQSGSFFHPRFDAHERRFPHYDRIERSVDGVLRAGGHRAPVPVVMTCGHIEENIENNRTMAWALAAQGYDVALHELADVHNYTAWRDAFDPYLTRLLRMVSS